jgi:hypothetical protein
VIMSAQRPILYRDIFCIATYFASRHIHVWQNVRAASSIPRCKSQKARSPLSVHSGDNCALSTVLSDASSQPGCLRRKFENVALLTGTDVIQAAARKRRSLGADSTRKSIEQSTNQGVVLRTHARALRIVDMATCLKTPST